MTAHRVTVVCTDKGSHGRIAWDQFDVTGEHIIHIATRRGQSALRGKGTAQADGRQVRISVGARMIVPVASSQAENGTWRWRCPKCGRDRPLTEANLRKALVVLARNGAPVLDISLIPE